DGAHAPTSRGCRHRGSPRRAIQAGQSGGRRSRSDAAPAHRVHRLTDRTARIGDVTDPEFTTVPCPWHLAQVENAIAAGDTKVTIARIPDLRSGVPIGVAYAECRGRKLPSEL